MSHEPMAHCVCCVCCVACVACSDVRDQLAPACKKQVFKVQMDAAMDYRADPQLYEACKDDAATACKDVKMGGGRVQACLVSGCGCACTVWLL